MEAVKKNTVSARWDFEIKLYEKGNTKSIPIIINNYNRLESLVAMVEKLHNLGFFNIYIIDNKSKYKPLLRYYAHSSLNIFYLNDNVGYLALWQTEIYDLFADSYIVYSDPDILPDEKCPHDFIERFIGFLKGFPELDKVGFGLRIDDLPDHYKLKPEVISHESKFWEKEICEGLLDAPVDTTFALYKPHRDNSTNRLKGARTDFPYVARHIPWYVDSSNPSKEEKWYLNCRKKFTHWSNHPENFLLVRKYYILIRNDQLPLIWNLRKALKGIFSLSWLKKNH